MRELIIPYEQVGEILEELYRHPTVANYIIALDKIGFNIVPVVGKSPLWRWKANEKVINLSLVREKLDRATGYGICAGPFSAFKGYGTIILDIDNPSLLEKWPELLVSSVSWQSGLRCKVCKHKHFDINTDGAYKCKKCGNVFTKENAERGMGILLAIKHELLEQLRGTIRGKDIEILVNNYAVAAPSWHPHGVAYEWINTFTTEEDLGIYAIESKEELNKIINIATDKVGKIVILGDITETKNADEKKEEEENTKNQNEEKQNEEKKDDLRTLTDKEISEVKGLLIKAYTEGNRQNLWSYLSGWGAKAKINPLDVARILLGLYVETRDDEDLKKRAGGLLYSYVKAGVDMEKYISELEKTFNVKLDIPRVGEEEDLKGKSGIQELLEETMEEEEALKSLIALEKIFGVASPYQADSVFEVLNEEKRIYAVANLRRKILARVEWVKDKNNQNKLIYKEHVAGAVPVRVEIFVNPIDQTPKYKIEFETITGRRFTIGSAFIDEIIDMLKVYGVVKSRRLIEDVLTAVVLGFERKGRAIIKEEVESAGFFFIKNQLRAVKYEVKRPSQEELLEAVNLLNELGEKWYSHIQSKFATIIRWGIVAPFAFAIKQKKYRWLPWLYLHGSSHTGKSTLGEIILNLWGHQVILGGSAINTQPRLGQLLSSSTFPVVVNEVAEAIERSEIVEMIKSAVESTIARGKFIKGVYREIAAYASVIFTSNRTLPKDDALLRRFLVLTFTYAERTSKEKAQEFDAQIKPKLHKLQAIGQFVADEVLKNPDVLSKHYDEVALILLKKAYETVGLTLPEWLYLKEKEEIDVFEHLKERILAFLIKRINDDTAKYFGKIEVYVESDQDEEGRWERISRTETEFSWRVETLLKNDWIPWALLKDGMVYIFPTFADEMENIIGDIGGLKSIAEIMGWEYGTFRINRNTVRKCARVRFEDFIAQLREAMETEKETEEKGRAEPEIRADFSDLSDLSEFISF